MLADNHNLSVDIDDYLAGETDSDLRHELMNGEIFAMSGAWVNHNRISSSTARHIGNHLADNPENQQNCEVFTSDMKVRVEDNFFYPDVVVTCEENLAADALYTEKPLLIIEVLSKSTRKNDHVIKRHNYTQIPTLEEYVLIEQDIGQIEVVRKCQSWQSSYYYLDDNILFESINLELAVSAIYARVDNEDVRRLLQDTL
jgi:Uma2 family endonuclease